MRKYSYLIIVVLSSITFSVHSQSDNKFHYKNSAHLELGGHGVVYSLNYERILINRTSFKTAIQAGMSYYPPSIGLRDTWFPFCVNELISFGNHHLEAGLGLIINREAGRDIENNPTTWFWSFLAAGRIGYRFQKPNSRLLFRIGFTPFYELDRNVYGGEFIPHGGVSLGYAF